MPQYEFECPKCKKVILLTRSINDKTSVLCCEDSCGPIEMKQIISVSSFSLKGSGWAKDGYSK